MDDASNGWDAVAEEYIARRRSNIGLATVRRWAATLPVGGSILDLGCGYGVPISEALAADGFNVHGIDASPVLVQEFRRRLPDVPVRCEAVETSAFFDRRFDAAIAIGLMFLLVEDAQRQLIHRISVVLHPGGRFLFTAPVQNVTWTDILTGRPSRSLGDQAYTAILAESGLELVEEFVDEGENHYYSARKPAT